jgi:neutral amino acid transport system ATP-binding protein
MILDVRDIRKSFGGVKALDGASLSLRPGTITSLFGANGSGKSTLFNIISGYLHADGGAVRLRDRAILGQAPLRVARNGVGRTWQSPRVFKDLSVLDNLLMAVRPASHERLMTYLGFSGNAMNSEASQKATKLLAEVGLTGRERETAGALSLGQQKLLSVAMLLMNDPDVILLDEPFAGVSPVVVRQIADVMLALKKQGHTILLIEHNITVARSISDQVLQMRNGRVEVIKPLAA